jgi:hypothetical protein
MVRQGGVALEDVVGNSRQVKGGIAMTPFCLYIRGCPGTGKHTVARILQRDLGCRMLWVHDFDAVYKAIGEHRVPLLTDRLMGATARYLMETGQNLIYVRPSRSKESVAGIRHAAIEDYGFSFTSVRLWARYSVMCQRVERRWHESDFRVTTKAGLDEYLSARPEEPFAGETCIETSDLEPEEVAAKIKRLLP